MISFFHRGHGEPPFGWVARASTLVASRQRKRRLPSTRKPNPIVIRPLRLIGRVSILIKVGHMLLMVVGCSYLAHRDPFLALCLLRQAKPAAWQTTETQLHGIRPGRHVVVRWWWDRS